ncbi:MAG: hypothetical protein ACJ788_14095 [Ktedonobacteraceae bacterium]
MSKSLFAPILALLVTLCILYWLCQTAFATTVVPLPFVLHPPTPTPAIHAVHHTKSK